MSPDVNTVPTSLKRLRSALSVLIPPALLCVQADQPWLKNSHAKVLLVLLKSSILD